MNEHKRTRRTKRHSLALALAAAATFAMSTSACTNPEVPAGHEGYIYYIPLVIGKMEYRKTLRGPGSTGVAWRLFTINIDMRQRTYTEMFQLLTADNLSIKFEVNTAIKLRDGQVKKIVENWGGSHWYEWRVKEPSRTTVRRAVAEQRADQIQTQTQQIAKQIRDQLVKQYDKTPIEIRSVDIGHIEFPSRYSKAIQRKVAKTEELKRQAAELLKTEEEAKKQVVNALNVAHAQRIISESLSPLYVQYRAVQVYKKLAGSSNKSIMLLPNTSDGTGIPRVLSTRSTLRKLSQADRDYLERMKKENLDEQTLVDMRAAVDILKREMKREALRSQKRKDLGKKTPKKAPAPKNTPAPKKTPEPDNKAQPPGTPKTAPINDNKPATNKPAAPAKP